MKKNVTFMIIIIGLIVVLPIHALRDIAQALWSYLRSWYYLDTYYLNDFYEKQIKMYEEKINAVQEFNTIL